MSNVSYDIVILNGTLVEPRRQFSTVANLGISKGIIQEISREKMTGKMVIEAKGKIVCPGFIDIHCHVDGNLYPAQCMARQGVTTCITGNCGVSMHPTGAFLDRIEQEGFPINHGTFVGHSMTLRKPGRRG